MSCPKFLFALSEIGKKPSERFLFEIFCLKVFSVKVFGLNVRRIALLGKNRSDIGEFDWRSNEVIN